MYYAKFSIVYVYMRNFTSKLKTIHMLSYIIYFIKLVGRGGPYYKNYLVNILFLLCLSSAVSKLRKQHSEELLRKFCHPCEKAEGIKRQGKLGA